MLSTLMALKCHFYYELSTINHEPEVNEKKY